MMNMRLEDQAGDVLKKFRFGRKRTLKEIAEGSGLDTATLRGIEGGEIAPSPAQLLSLGRTLGFDGARMEWIHLHPDHTPEKKLPRKVRPVLEDFDGYAVWCALVLHQDDPGRALLIDTGGGGAILRETIREADLRIEGVLLTHGHQDHGGGVTGLPLSSGVPVLIERADRSLLPEIGHYSGPVLTPEEGLKLLREKGWAVSLFPAPGHTPGSVAYLTRGVLFVGDTLFCGSAGRCFSPDDFQTQLASIGRLVSENAPETLILSGHGPFTSVGEERTFNPFVRVRESIPGVFSREP